MKIKLNELHPAEWTYYNCSADNNLYEGKVITYRESKRFGYRYTVILLHDTYYLTQALLNPTGNSENISVYVIKSINDAKACMEVMIQFNKNYHKPVSANKPVPVINYDA